MTTFKLDPEIILGTDVIGRIGPCAAALGKKALVISGQGGFESRLLRRIVPLLEDAGVETISSDTTPLLPAADVAGAAGELARGGRCSLIIALGGAQVQALARTAAAIGPARQDVHDFLDGEIPAGPFLPVIAVPTEGSDPFLFSRRYVLTDPRDRLVKFVRGPEGVCRAAFLDSGITGAAPEQHPLAGTFEGFLAALESWCSARADALSDALLEKALGLFAALWPAGGAEAGAGASPETEPPADGDGFGGGDDFGENSDFEAGAENAGVAQAACLLSLGAAASPPGIGTALAWAVGSRFPVERSLIAAALLPAVAERLAPARPEKAARAAVLIGAAEENLPVAEKAERLAGGIRAALEAASIPLRLRDAGLNLDRMASAAEAGRSLEFVAQSPWTVAAEDAWELLRAAW